MEKGPKGPGFKQKNVRNKGQSVVMSSDLLGKMHEVWVGSIFENPLSSSCQFIFAEMLKGQLGVPLTYVYPWYLLCSTLGFWGIF